MTSEVITAMVVAAVVLGALGRRWWLHGQRPLTGSGGSKSAVDPAWLLLVLHQLEQERQLWLRAATAQESAHRAMWRVVRRSRS